MLDRCAHNRLSSWELATHKINCPRSAAARALLSPPPMESAFTNALAMARAKAPSKATRKPSDTRHKQSPLS